MTISLKLVDSPSFQRQPNRTRLLANAGFAAPDEHAALTSRLASFRDLDKPITARLVEALVSGEGDVEALRAAAIAEHGAVHLLNERVDTAIANHLAGIVAENAAATYKDVQRKFNAAAAAFTKAAAVVDPTTSAHDILALNDLRVQKSWQDAATHSAELDSLLVPLIASAMSASVRHPAAHDSVAQSRTPKTKAMAFGLVVDASGVESYRVAWDAFDDENAWAELLKVNAVIFAKDLDVYEAARIPSRLMDKKVLREDGTYIFVTVDPDLEPVETR